MKIIRRKSSTTKGPQFLSLSLSSDEMDDRRFRPKCQRYHYGRLCSDVPSVLEWGGKKKKKKKKKRIN